MKSEYIVTNQELQSYGLDLNEYALDGACVYAIILKGLDIAITRCAYLNDSLKGERKIEQALDSDQDLVEPFKKLQRNIIWNLIFTATDDPVDQYIDTIIVHELGWGKINGFQKGLWYKNY